MKVGTSATFHAGNFPHVARDLAHFRPNCVPMLNFVADLDAKDLKREGRWLEHVLRQLSFSYLKKGFVETNARTVLEALPAKVAHLPGLARLRDAVDDVVCSKTPLTTETAPALNDLALEMFVELESGRAVILVESLEGWARFALAEPNVTNARRAAHYWNLLMVAMRDHMRERAYALAFRDALDFVGYEDWKTMRAMLRPRLDALRDNLVRVSSATCVFFCKDIKFSTEAFRLGATAFLPSTSKDEILGTAEAASTLVEFGARHPNATLAVVRAACHPHDPKMALLNASRTAHEAFGFLVSHSGLEFGPPAHYAGVAVVEGSGEWCTCSASAELRDSLSVLLLRPEDGPLLANLYDRFISPVFDADVEPVLQEKLRRVLRTLRRVAFSARSGELSQACATVWQAYELVFGGAEGRGRGLLIARRVAAMSVTRDAFCSDDSVELSNADVLGFARSYVAGDAKFSPKFTDFDQFLRELVQNGVVPNDENLLHTWFSSDDLEHVFEWKQRELADEAARLPHEVKMERVVEKRDQLAARILDYYRLRNDIVHAGYDNEGAMTPLLDSMLYLLKSFVLNLGFNFQKKRDYATLLSAVDAEWAYGRSFTDSGALSLLVQTAYFLWLDRGCPVGDDWADWFAADDRINGSRCSADNSEGA